MCLFIHTTTHAIFGVTVASSGSPCATGLLSCLSVTLVYCGQMAGWIKIPLGTEVGRDFVLYGDPPFLPRGKGHSSLSTFWPMSVVAKLLDQYTTWYGNRPQLRRHCVRWGPSSPPHTKGHSSPPVLTHVYCGQTFAHLSNC